MKRRAGLLIGTFAALLAAFWAYRLVARWAPQRPEASGEAVETDAPRHGEMRGAGSFDEPEPQRGEKLKIETREDGVVRQRFACDRYEKVGTHEYKLVRPRISFFFEDGREAHLRADRGRGRFAGSIMDVDFQQLYLADDVVLTADRGTSPLRGPLSERPEDRVVVRMDAVLFDRHLLRIETNSDVEMHLAEADVFGRGLEITWTENPRQLELVRITQGKRIVLHDVPEGVDLVALPGAASGETGERRGTPAPAPTTRPAPSAPAATRPQQGDRPDNVYRLELFDNVALTAPTGRVEQAETLALRFEWDRSMTRRRQQAPSPRGEEPAGEATQPATRPAGQKRQTVIRWRGDLVLRPVGWTASPSSERYTATARGAEVRLTDGKTTATCRSFTYWQEPAPPAGRRRQRGRLTGTAEDPATLTLGDGSRVECEIMRYDRTAGRAVLDGPGRMVDQGGSAFAATEGGAERAPDRPRRITWGDMVIVRFAERTVDGRTRQEIDEAWFHGGVRLRQGTSDDEEFVHCDELRVDMTDLGGRVAPSEAVAIGNVHARQEGRDIRADRGVLQFEPHRSRPGEPLEMRPARFDALGNVRVADPDADEPLEATADRIVSDLVQRNAVLYGGEKQAHWAEMRQGANRLRGREIHLYQVPDLRGSGRELEVRTEGYGTLDFRTRRGLDGRDLASARPVRIAWSRSMSYQGDRDTAEFFGDVELDSGPDHMAAEAMRVRFERTEARGDAAPEAPDEGDEDALALSMENYSKRRIAMIRAEGSDPAERNVLLRRRQTDEAGRLLRRMQLRSTDLQYDATLARVIITSWGKMVAEDYRPPERDAPDEGGLVAADVQRPSQTVIEWQAADARDREGDRGPACYMELLQKRRQATVHGDVTLRHRSGRKIVRAASLRVPEWGELPPGRRMDLRCGHAVVWFAEPDAAGDDDGEAPALGRFERFSAARRVNFQYGPWQILGERVLYSRTEDVATAWGYRKGATPADAQVVHEDVETGRSQTWSSPKVQVFPRTERVVTEGGTGTFGR